MNIKQRLINESEKDFQKFSAFLIPNINNVLGVRLPKLRKIAKEIYKNGDWQEFINLSDFEYMEETMLKGMIIGLVKQPPPKILELVRNFIPEIDNWSVCDCFCSSLKFVKDNKELVWNFIQPYFKSKNEYDIRFAYVILLSYYIDINFIDKALKIIDGFKDKRYYTKMAVAWALSICYIKFPEKTLEYLKISKLDNWTYNKGIQKICESLRVDKSTKTMLKSMKKK